MANKEQLKILERGTEIWNEWRRDNEKVNIDLRHACFTDINLDGIDLMDADLRYANFKGASLRRATLIKANLGRATLSDVDFSGSYLYEASLIQADIEGGNLTEVKLNKANLFGANLSCTNLSKSDLNGSNLSYAKFIGANLSQADLTFCTLAHTNFENAILSGSRIYGISVWDIITNDDTKQSSLIITKEDESIITVDNLKVAQFIYLMLNNTEIRDIIDTITSKVVLIIGRFTVERKAVLDAIREELKKFNYIPVMFDFTPCENRDTHETITLLARMARFVIADITDPRSIPQEMISVVETLPSLPVQPILKKGEVPWGMYDHIKKYPWVLPIQEYDNIEDIIYLFGQNVIKPVKTWAKRRKGNI